MKKVSILQEDITMFNVFAPQKSVKIPEGKTDRTARSSKYTIITEDINIPLLVIDRSSRQKLSTDNS